MCKALSNAMWLSVFVVVLLAGGCSTVQSPGVDINRVEIGEISDEAFVLNFHLQLDNPNHEPLSLSEFHYQLSLNGATVYSGRRSAEATLRAEGGKEVIVPAVVRFDRAGLSGVPDHASYAFSGTLSYLAPGHIAEILFDTGVHRPEIGFRKSGELTMAGGS